MQSPLRRCRYRKTGRRLSHPRGDTKTVSLSLSLFSLFLPRARLFESAFSRLSRGFFLSFSRNPKKRKEKCRGIHHHTRRERDRYFVVLLLPKRFKKKFFALSPLHKRARVVGTLHSTSLHSFSPIIWWDALERLLFENAFSFSRAKCFFKGKICVLKNTRKIHRRNVH